MNDKEKQIEEMAKIANYTAFDYRQGTIKSKTIYTAIAEAIYKYITEDSVVLTQDEVDEFRKDQTEVKFLKKQITDQVRKETAEKILNMGKKLYEMSYHKSNAMPRLTEWIKVEYGVKVEG